MGQRSQGRASHHRRHRLVRSASHFTRRTSNQPKAVWFGAFYEKTQRMMLGKAEDRKRMTRNKTDGVKHHNKNDFRKPEDPGRKQDILGKAT